MRIVDSLNKTEAALGRVISGAGAAVAWLTLALVLLVAANVLMRYMFSMGAVAFQELEWHLLSPIALIGMSYSLRSGAHVRVDLLYERFPAPLRRVVDLLAGLLLTAMAGILVYLSIPYVGQSLAIGEGSPDPGGLPYRFLLKAFIPLGFGLLALQAFAEFLRAALDLARASGTAADLAVAMPQPQPGE